MAFVGVREITGTSDTPSTSDEGYLLRCTNASLTTITLDNTAWTAGRSTFVVLSEGAAGVTFAASGTTINNTVQDSTPSVAQYAMVVCSYTATNVWTVTGEVIGDLNLQESAILNAGPIESKIEVASVSTSKDLDTSLYGWFDITMTAATTFTFSNPAPNGNGTAFILDLQGAYTPTFPGSVDWDNGGSPVYATPAQYVFTTNDGGTIWLGSLRGTGFA